MTMTCSPSEENPTAAGATQPGTSRLRVLVVDDDPETRRLVDRTLRDVASVNGCTKVDDALRLLRGAPVDVLILDLILLDSGSNGLELLRRLPKHGRPGRVVVLTAW